MADAATAEPQAEAKVTPYDRLGGAPVVQALAERFYDIMEAAPEAAHLRAMHAPDLGPMKEKLYQFLSGWLGGPPLYFQRADSKCMGSAHKPFNIGEQERDEWMWCIRQAMQDVNIDADLRPLLDKALYQMADFMRAK